MSHDSTNASGHGEGFSIINVDGTPTTVYHQEAEMSDTASSSVKVEKEVIAESILSSLGLTPQDTLSVDALRELSSVTGSSAAQMRK